MDSLSDKTPAIPSGETPDTTSFSSLRESLSEENALHIQSMQQGYRRNYRQAPPQSSCQTPSQEPCQTPSQDSCLPPAQDSCQNSPQNSCQNSHQAPPQNSCRNIPEPQPFTAYQAAMPYPLVCPQGRNMQYAAAILDNMSGQISEMSSAGFYFYNNLITSEYRELAEVFHHISLVEMHHLEIFGKLAMKLGENPRLWYRRGRNGSYAYWTPGCLRYPPFPIPSPVPADQQNCCPPAANTAIKAILSQSIEGEEGAIRKYMQQTTWIQDVNVCDNLRRISADEQVHVEIFTRLYHKY